MALPARPVHGLGALDAVARHVHGHASGHQVPEHLGVAAERGPMRGCVAPFVPEAQRLAAALVHRGLELVEIAALDGLQQRLVPLVLGAAHVQRVGRTPVVHVYAAAAVFVVVVVVDDVTAVVVVVSASSAAAHHYHRVRTRVRHRDARLSAISISRRSLAPAASLHVPRTAKPHRPRFRKTERPPTHSTGTLARRNRNGSVHDDNGTPERAQKTRADTGTQTSLLSAALARWFHGANERGRGARCRGPRSVRGSMVVFISRRRRRRSSTASPQYRRDTNRRQLTGRGFTPEGGAG